MFFPLWRLSFGRTTRKVDRPQPTQAVFFRFFSKISEIRVIRGEKNISWKNYSNYSNLFPIKKIVC